MKLRFTKMQGLGNDFVVIDGVNQRWQLSKQQVQHLADRHYGIGCDQLLLLEPATDPKADFKYRIFNANGSEVEQCGNGARCIAKFIAQENFSKNKICTFETMKGLVVTVLKDNGSVSVEMGAPRFSPKEIPLLIAEERALYNMSYQGKEFSFSAVNMGNPHAVFMVENLDTTPVAELGSFVEHHALFPEGVNVSFMQIINFEHIKLRVYERHVGETQACGSGACAAVVSGIAKKLLRNTVKVSMLGGELEIHWSGDHTQPVTMTGAAEFVFQGEITL